MRLLEAYYVTTERESVNTVPFIPTNVYLNKDYRFKNLSNNVKQR